MRNKRQKGVSILEVLIALLILSVGLLAIIGTFPKMLELSLGSENMAVAQQSAQDKMDEILSAGAFISTSANSDAPSGLQSGYRRWYGTNISSRLQQITVEVGWVEKGRARSFSVNSMIGK